MNTRVKRVARTVLSIFIGVSISLCMIHARGEEPVTAPAIEWKESWDATYSYNREVWEKELKVNPQRGRKAGQELPSRMSFLLESLLKKYSDDTAHRIPAYTELAELLVQLNQRTKSCEYRKKVIDESRGKADVALAALQGIIKTYPKYYETAEARQWQEYAGRRLMALLRVGYISSTNPALNEAMECLLSVRSEQGRFLEAAQILDALRLQSRSDDRIKIQEAELYFKLGQIDKALECYQAISFVKQDHQVQQRIAQLSSHRWMSGAFEQTSLRPEFDKKLQNILSGKLDENLSAADGLLQEDADGRNVVSLGAQFASAWRAIDANLRAIPDRLQALRQVHPDEAAALLAAARKSRREDDLLPVFRKFPWTDAGHQALLEYGERQLFLGNAELAARSFEDVLSHSNSSALQAQARTGLQIARAQKPESDDEAVHAVASPITQTGLQLPAMFPWPAEMIGDIPPDVLSQLAWPGMVVTARGGRTFVSGLNVLVCYGTDLSKPLWVRGPAAQPGAQGELDATRALFFHAPAPLRPEVAGGTVYMRWGLDATHCFPSHLSAFDAVSGETLWSTAQDPEWQRISPIGDPVYSCGKIYAMVIGNGSSRSASALPISLICLDAKTGEFHWLRHLANHQLTTLPRIGARDSDNQQERNLSYADMFHYGNAVRVEGGAVYCLTNCGVVARVDARDGVIEWVTSYSRSTPNASAMSYLQREGAAPTISGARVICVARDCEGVFALDKENGRQLWENPFASSQQVLAATPDALLVADRSTVVSLDPATGRTRWFRSFVKGIACRPAWDGESVIVASGDKLQRIQAATGASLEEVPLEKGRTPVQIAPHGGALLAASIENLQAFPFGKQEMPAAAAMSPQKLGIPLQEVWQSQLPNPEIVVPPPSAGIQGRVFVSSEGLLECLDTGAIGKIVWRRFVSPGCEGIAWAKGTMLLCYGRSIDALDAGSGELKWRCATPFSAENKLVNAPYLFFSEMARLPQIGAIDLTTGTLLWSRRIDQYYNKTVPMIFDGTRLHLLGLREGDESRDVLLDPHDGRTVGTLSYLPRQEPIPRGVWAEGTQGFLLADGLTVHTFAIQDSKPALTFFTDLRSAMRRFDMRADARWSIWDTHFKGAQTNGRWMDLEQYSGHAQNPVHWIFDRTDSDNVLCRKTAGVIRGDRLYDASGKALVVIDLATHAEIATYSIPGNAATESRVRIVEFWEEGDAMFVVSGCENAGQPGALRIDAFDPRTAGHRGGQILAGVPYWNVTRRKTVEGREPIVQKWRGTQAVAAGAGLFVSDAQGVHAFAAVKNAEEKSQRPTITAYRQATAIVADGSLKEWADAPGIAPSTGDGGELRVSHDAENLYVAVSAAGSRLRARFDGQELARGDWLEIGLSTCAGSFRGCVGLDARGQCYWEDAAGGLPLSGEVQAGVRGDFANGTSTYELAIPLRAIARRDDPEWRRMGISAAVWEDASLGPRKTCEWGGGVAGPQTIAEAHQPIFLDSMTPGEEQAAWAVVNVFPELKASRDFIQKISATRGASYVPANAFLTEQLKAHAADASAGPLLEAFDFSIRAGGGDPLKVAEAAGVPAGVRERYRALASAYISQWVYLDPERPPRMIMLQFNDGSGWEHRMSWGSFSWPMVGVPGTASRRTGGVLPPCGSWQELRVPLLWVGLQDSPIRGISFGQHGGGRVCWDRTSLFIADKETVLIDGAVPDGKKEGHWEWMSQPKRSEARAHANRIPLDAEESIAHSVSNLKKPFDAQLVTMAAASVDVPKLSTLLEQQIPKMGSSDEAMAFLRELMALEGQKPDAVRARIRWFIGAVPQHPANVELLGRLLELFKKEGAAQPAEEVEGSIKAAKVPAQTAYDYRRKFIFTARNFVRNVQVLGPFPDPMGVGYRTALAPEGKPVDLVARLQMGDFVLEWKALKSDRGYIDLARVLKPPEHAVAFAAFYVQCDKARGGMMEISADDGCKVWINQKLVHSHRNPGIAIPGERKSRVFFPAGVNEVLVKIDNSTGDWGFFMEFVEADGRGPMQGIKLLETAQ